MMRSMFSGVSGLRVHQTKMDVIANNIANVNTTGFKSQRATFRDAFYQRIQGASAENPLTGRTGTNPMQIGLGTNLASIDNIMTQGISQRTDNSYDAMIQGEGFFIVGDSSGTFFTRAGNISRDANWNLNINGMALQGWDTVKDEATGQDVIQKGNVKPMNLGGEKQYVPPSPTTLLEIAGNLNVNDLNTKTDPQGNEYKDTTVSVDFYDSAGNNYTTDVTFKYFEYEPTGGNSNLQNHVEGFWTFEFKTADPKGENAAAGVVVYPEGDRKNPKTVALHCGGADSLNTVPQGGGAATGAWDANFSPKGIMIFDTDGGFIGWDTLNVTTTAMTDPNTNTQYQFAAHPTLAEVKAQVDALGLVYNAATGKVIGAANLTAAEAAEAGRTAGPGGLGTNAAGWRTLEGTDDQRMELLITPIDVLDPTATFGELTADVTMVHAGEGATINAPANTGDPTADHIVQVGTMSIDFSDLNQWGGESSPTELKPDSVDGNEPGTLQDISIANDGKITGRYSNGETKLLGQIAVAKFDNPAGLDRMGSNLFAATTNSGPFNGYGTEGDIMSGALEMSNVDLSQEFTEMITTQRGFQANSRTITVSDEMLQELVNLKR